jgi:hypothetical protein
MREFTLDKILTVTTGCLVSRNHMDGLYDILGYMTNDPGLTTIGILAVGERCATELLRQHPQLVEIEVPKFDIMRDGEQSIWDWVEVQEAKYGKSLTVAPFGDSFDRETDLEVIQRVRGNTDNVIVVVTD